jgi:hypothetical protein
LTFFLVWSRNSNTPLYPQSVAKQGASPTFCSSVVFTSNSHLSLSKNVRAHHVHLKINLPIPYEERKIFSKGKKVMICATNNKKFLHLLHKTMHLCNHNNNTCDNMLHFTNYKFCNGITMHEHKMNMKSKNFDKFDIQWTWRMKAWIGGPFGLSHL